MQVRNLRYWIGITQDLGDAEFEAMVSQVRQVRAARAEAIAYERAMNVATCGLAQRFAERNSPAGVERDLISQYARLGFSPDQIGKRLRELR